MDQVQYRTLILVCSQHRLVQTPSQDFISQTWLLRSIWTATSKLFLLGNQLSSHPSGFCAALPSGITVISPLKKDMTGHKSHRELDQHLSSAFSHPFPLLVFSSSQPDMTPVPHPDACHVSVCRMIDNAEVRHIIRAGEPPIHKSTAHAPLIRNCVLFRCT